MRAYGYFRKAIELHIDTLEETRPELRKLLSALTSQLSARRDHHRWREPV